MGGFLDVSVWGLAWAPLAAVAGLGLAAVAAMALKRRPAPSEPDLNQGYDALAPVMRRPEV